MVDPGSWILLCESCDNVNGPDGERERGDEEMRCACACGHRYHCVTISNLVSLCHYQSVFLIGEVRMIFDSSVFFIYNNYLNNLHFNNKSNKIKMLRI
jgi:hypothetical protein